MTSFWLAAVFTAATFCQLPIRLNNQEEYSPKEGNFTIDFPGKPKETTQTIKAPNGELKVFTATYSDGNGNVFLVSYADLPAESTKPDKLEALFEGVRDGAKGMNGTILDDDKKAREFGPNKLPARKLELKKGEQRVRLRLIISGQRLYQIAVAGSPDLFKETKVPEKFIESFKIISK